MNVLADLRAAATTRYSPQVWLLFGGYFCNRASASLIWPFLTLVMRERLDVPLSTVTTLVSIQAAAALISITIIGAVMDRFGRKNAMVLSILAMAGVLVAMTRADRVEQWVVLIALYGMLHPVFMVGSNAMVADLVKPKERTNAYALMRTISNLGFTIGPAAGGMLMALSESLTYYLTAGVNVVIAVLVAIYIADTLSLTAPHKDEPRSGYGSMLRHREFVTFWLTFMVLELAATLIFTLLAVYTKEHFQIPQEHSGLLVSLNAGMVVLFQFRVAQIASRYRQLMAMAVGALFYVAGLLAFALSQGLPAFAVSIAIITVGELIVAPVSIAMVANMAPATMRARYMGAYSMAYTFAQGIGPAAGGYLSDHIAPVATWYGGALAAAVAACGFLFMARARGGKVKEVAPSAPAIYGG